MKFAALLTFLTFAFLADHGLSQAPPPPAPFVHPVFSTVLNADGGFDDNPGDFDILSSLIKYADFDSQFSEGVNLTLLAPTDGAFMRTSMALGTVEEMSESNAYDAIMKTVTDGMNVDGQLLNGTSLVKMILSYHIIGGRVPVEVFQRAGFLLTTLSLPLLATPSGEIIDLSSLTPNPSVIGGVYDSDGLLINALDYALFPFEVPAEKWKYCINPFDPKHFPKPTPTAPELAIM